MLNFQDDPRFTAVTIPPFVLTGLLDYVHAENSESENWLKGTGLTLEQFQQPDTLVSFRQITTVIRRILKALPPDDAVGLQLGSRGGLVSFGMLGFAMMSSRNLQEALEVGIKYHQASGSLMDVSAEISSAEVTLRIYERFPDPELLPFLCEELFASSTAILRAMLGHSTSPRRVELKYPEPIYGAAYRRLFNCPVYFNSDANRLVFDAVLLDQPLLTYSPASLSGALAACRQLLEPTEPIQQDIVAAVENLLRNNLRQRLSMAEVANQLNVTERTLRRHLLDAGESFSRIRDRVLEKRARILLFDSSMPVTAISEELGYSDLREFRRAFQRWTGMAPVRLRQLQNKKDNPVAK